MLQNILTGDSPNTGRGKINTNNEVIPKLIDAVSGGSGFKSVAGAESMELDPTVTAGGRAFLHTVTADTEFGFANIPSADEAVPFWFWALKMDAVGGHAITFNQTVHAIDGESLDDLNVDANGLNLAQFFAVGGEVYWTLIYTGTVRLSDYTFWILGDETIAIPFKKSEDVDLDNVTIQETNGNAADGTLSFEKGSGGTLTSVSGLTTFDDGDMLVITRAGGTNPAGARMPSYAA